MRCINMILGCLLLVLCLTGCNSANQQEKKEYTYAENFMIKESVQPPIEQKKDNQLQQQKTAQIKEIADKTLNYKEVRAVWLSYIDLSPMLTGKSEDEFRKAFETACKNITDIGCNTVYVHVRPFGDALYDSKIYPASKYITGIAGGKGTFDPLKVMVEIAHSHRLSIHGWINPLRLESPDCFEKYNSSIIIKRWYDSSNGYIHSIRADKHLWLDPGYSDVRNLIADGAAEIVRNYDVDGIHYDDYFYPTTDAGFDKVCFVQASTEKSLSVWRLENISAMVKQIYDAVKTVNRSAVVGVSPQGNIENNYNYLYADVKKWGSEKGYVDYICPQIYYGYNNPVKPFLQTLNAWESIVTDPSVSLYVGLAVYKTESGENEFVQSIGIIARQIGDICKSKTCKGFCLYAYNNLFKDTARSRKELDSIIGEIYRK